MSNDNPLTDALPCPYCGANPDVDSYGDITCPIGLTSQEGREEHEQQGLFCRNDSIMKLDDWNRRSENGAPPALLAAAREAARLREENERLRQELAKPLRGRWVTDSANRAGVAIVIPQELRDAFDSQIE